MFTRRAPIERNGTTAVETAIVLPVFFLFLFSLIEVGHAQLIKNMINSSCRTGARLGATEGQSTADVESHVRDVLASVMAPEDAHVFVKSADEYDTSPTPPTDGESIESLPDIELAEADPRKMFVVRARVNYNDVALVPMPFMSGVVLQGQAFMRHE